MAVCTFMLQQHIYEIIFFMLLNHAFIYVSMEILKIFS